jgi:iron complex transport system substrate-binding protein
VRRMAVAVALALLLAGCGSTPEVGSEQAAAQRGTVGIGQVHAVDDPRSLTGPVSVTLPDEPIEPVAEDVQPDLPVTVTDAQGTEVTVSDTDRILALDLSGSLSRTVFELGLGDSVVGRDVSSTFPEIADRPLVTADGHDLNGEAILELAPTVIITDTSLGPWDVVLQMRDAGIPVVVVDSHRGIDNLADLTGQVADALGVPELGRRLGRRIQAETDAMVREIALVAPRDVTGKLRMIFLYVRGQAGIYYMFGSGSGADSLIEAIGGYDVSGEIGWDGMKPVNDEGLVAAQPDVILMMSEGLASVDGVDGLLEQLPAIAETPAGQSRRIITMDDAHILGFGPRTAEVLETLAIATYAPAELS